MKLNQIRDVIAVAERGSLRSAARYLNIAQPAITRSIRDLENELGTPLFERHATGVELTAAGKAFVQRTSAIQEEVQRAKDEVAQLSDKKTGTVTMALSTVSHLALLPRALPSFSRTYPDVVVRIIEGLFPATEAGLLNGSIDFYVGPLSGGPPSGELSVEHLFSNNRLILGRKKHPLASATSLADLTDASWITTAVTAATEDELTPLFTRAELPPPRVAMKVQTGLSMITTVAYSNHLAMLPQQWLEFTGVADLVESFPIDVPIPAPSICMVRRSKLPLTPVAEHMADLFRRASTRYQSLV